MENEVRDCVVEDLLKQLFSCRDFSSKNKIMEKGRQTPFLTKMVKQSKNGLCHIFDSWYKTELQDLENSLNFCNSMIDIFTEKNYHMELKYKV
jgi:hypothetical protein